MLTMAEERDVTQSVKALRRLWFIASIENQALWAWSEFNGYAS